METLYPTPCYMRSSWMVQESKRTKWTQEENNVFESALALFDKETPDRWINVAAFVPGKSVCDVIKQYKELEAFLSKQHEEEETILSKLMPIELSCQSPRSRFDSWVFWSKEDEGNSSVLAIQNQIKTFLCSFEGTKEGDPVLVQFWAAETTMVGGRRRHRLTTSQQPFAFTNIYEYRKDYIYEDLIEYRKHCLGYKIEDGDGVIGRVFQNQLPEVCPNLRCYSLKDHPHRDVARSCGLAQVWAFPVLEPSRQSQSCVGVLEFLFSQYTFLHMTYIDNLCSDLERAGLLTLDTRKMREQIREGINHLAESYEIKEALQQVRDAHGLSLASAWVRCKHTTLWSQGCNPNSRYNDSNGSGGGDFVVHVPDLSKDDDYIELCYFLTLKHLIMRVGQGLIGNAFLSDKPFICRDVTQLSMSQYPMVYNARRLGFTGCITICLQSIATGIRDYVLEFYLSSDMAHSKNIQKLMSSMLVTLKHHLKSFEAVVGYPGDELFVQIDKYSIDSVFESLKTRPTILNEIEPGALHYEGEVLQPNFPGQNLAMEDFGNSGGIGGDSVGLKQRGKAILPESNCLEKKSKAHNQKESSCSYETLKRHFGRKLGDTAESLGVSRSTVKRWCRENNISRWPFPKRRKVTSLPPIQKQIKELIQVNLEPISDSSKKGPSFSGAPTDFSPKRAMNTVTVKATYKKDIIKFQLSFSSRMMDLVKKVTLRWKLSEGTFTIKYVDEDRDYIVILCDEDLQECIKSFRISEDTAIKMLIEPLAITLSE